jgi:2-phospho-L-lactate guanylyltransferase
VSRSPERVAAVVPIRSWTTGKSRLDLSDADREAVSRAFALDVVDVLLSTVDLVLVVSSDEDVRASLDGCTFLDDPGTGLNDAVAAGCKQVVADGADRVVVAPSDLPCLTAGTLTEVLRLAEEPVHAFCADADGDGTTLVVSREPLELVTSYGASSAAAHRAAGLVPLPAPAAARRDVDTVTHLREAEALGVRPRTVAVLDVLSGSRTATPVRDRGR